MELDEIDPARWAELEAATEEYLAQPATQAQFAEAAAALLQVGRGGAGGCHVAHTRCFAGVQRWQGDAGGSSGWRRRRPSPRARATRPPPASRCVQAEAGAAGEPSQPGGLKLGVRRKLVVLRAPRLGAQQVSVADAVATSVAFRPGCVAAVNLQQLVPTAAAPEDGKDAAAARAPLAAAAATTAPPVAAAPSSMQGQARTSTDLQPPAQPACPPGPKAEAAGAGLSEQEDGLPAAESSGLSAYLTSWFGSPSKQPRQPAPDGSLQPGAAAAAAATSRHSLSLGSRVSSLSSSPLQHAGLVAAPEAAAAPAAAVDSAALQDLALRLEERLEPLLPSVGVVHLGLEMAGGAGTVLRWRQRLQVVAEPSEWGLAEPRLGSSWGGGPALRSPVDALLLACSQTIPCAPRGLITPLTHACALQARRRRQCWRMWAATPPPPAWATSSCSGPAWRCRAAALSRR